MCPTEIIAFNDRLAQFAAIGADVFACSVDSEYAHLAWSRLARQQGGLGGPLDLPLLADTRKSLAEKFGVLSADGSVALRFAGKKLTHTPDWRRGTFVVDKRGIVRHASINDLGIGRSVDETLRLTKAIQFNDQHGEGTHFLQKDNSMRTSVVCPAGWSEGAKGIKPSTKKPLNLDEVCPPHAASSKPYQTEVNDLCQQADAKHKRS